MSDDVEQGKVERWRKFKVEAYVIPDGRTPEQIERDQRLLNEVRKLAQAKFHADDVDPRDRVIGKGTALARPLRTYEEALKGEEHLDYLPREACTICGRMPFWNGYRYDDAHDLSKHGALTEEQRLDRAIERVNSKPVSIGDMPMPLRVLSDDDD